LVINIKNKMIPNPKFFTLDFSQGEVWEPYRHEKKKTSHVNIGKNGKKNWLVTGIIRAAISKMTMPILANGPGAGLINKAKIPRMSSSRY
jgi:hypothetical protein